MPVSASGALKVSAERNGTIIATVIPACTQPVHRNDGTATVQRCLKSSAIQPLQRNPLNKKKVILQY